MVIFYLTCEIVGFSAHSGRRGAGADSDRCCRNLACALNQRISADPIDSGGRIRNHNIGDRPLSGMERTGPIALTWQ